MTIICSGDDVRLASSAGRGVQELSQKSARVKYLLRDSAGENQDC